MKSIQLNKNRVALVDDEDFGRVNAHKWHVETMHSGISYASTNIRLQSKPYKAKKIRMHRLIMNAPDGVEVDHWNGEGLDNQRGNLRLATGPQNQQNRTRLAQTNTSGYRGVTFHKRAQKWQASIKQNHKQHYLGVFETAESAARAYDAAARRMYGASARLHFPD
jgi:AP2 domain-containing protein